MRHFPASIFPVFPPIALPRKDARSARHSVPCALALALLAALPVAAPSQVPPECNPDQSGLAAFPGAEGWGATTPGGRCGTPVVVTTTEDYNPDLGETPIVGSLRHALDIVTGPRTIVFAVAGVINLKKELIIGGANDADLTLAGETAPGDGILIAGARTVIKNTHDVVVRHLRFRDPILPHPDCEAKPPKTEGDALTISNSSYVVVDHCTTSWGKDEVLSIGDSQDVTVQNSIIAEGLTHGEHCEGPHSRGTSVASCLGNPEVGCETGNDRISVHHNFFANNYWRNPNLEGPFGPLAMTPAQMDLRYNVMYNHGWATKLKELLESNVVGNHFDLAEAEFQNGFPEENSVQFQSGFGHVPKAFLEDNTSLRIEGCEPRSDCGGPSLPDCCDQALLVQGDFEPHKLDKEIDAPAVTRGDRPISYALNKTGALPYDPGDEAVTDNYRNKDGFIGRCHEVYAGMCDDLDTGDADSPLELLDMILLDWLPDWEFGTEWADSDGDGIDDGFEIQYACLLVGNDDSDDQDPDPGACTTDGYTDLEFYLHTVAAAKEEFFADEFEDSALDWDVSGAVTEEAGELKGVATNPSAFAPAEAFSECTGACIFEGTIEIIPPAGAPPSPRASLHGWYTDSTHNVEVTLLANQDRVDLTVRNGVSTQTFSSASIIDAGVRYHVRVEYTPALPQQGTIEVFVDDFETPLIISGIVPLPTGTIGFGAAGGAGFLADRAAVRAKAE